MRGTLKILYFSDDTLHEAPYAFIDRIAATYGTEIIILGQGSEGLILFDKTKDVRVHYKTVKTNEVVNTIGAGNALFDELYRSFKVSKAVVSGVLRKASLLLVNEVLWSGGMAMLNQSYSLRGLEVVSAVNIASTINQLFMCGVFSCGSVINIIVGQHLGAGRTDDAVETAAHDAPW